MSQIFCCKEILIYEMLLEINEPLARTWKCLPYEEGHLASVDTLLLLFNNN